MNAALFSQALVSFLAGGSVIALQTLLAEKASEKIAGIIMIFPSTIVIGFFFLGISTSAANVALVVPATLIPIGIILVSIIIYIYFAAFYASRIPFKTRQVAAAFLSASLLWLPLAAPFAIWKFNNLLLGSIGYGLIAAVTHFFLNKKIVAGAPARLVYTRRQIILRCAFVGTVIAGVVVASRLFGPFWGGVLTMYPAATFATLMVLHYYYSPEQIVFFMKKVPLGSLSLFAYAISAMVFFPRYGVFAGTVFSYATCLVFSLLLVQFQLKFNTSLPVKIKKP